MPSIQILTSQKNLILNYKSPQSTNLLSSNYVEKEEGTQSRGAYLTTRIVNWSKNSYNSNGVIVLDGDNIRGKTKFTISKEQLCDDVIKWSDSIGLSNRVILVFDHGSKHQAYYCNGIIIVFSGSRKSGDDIIARDIRWLQSVLNVDTIVITEDLLLRRRCKSNSATSRLSKKKMKKQSMINSSSSSSTTSGNESIMDGSTGNNNGAIDNGQRDLTIVSSPLFVEMLYGRTIDNGSIGDNNINISDKGVEDHSDDDDEDENDDDDKALDEGDDEDDSDDVDGKIANDVKNNPSSSSTTTTSKDALKVTSITERELQAIKPHLKSRYHQKHPPSTSSQVKPISSPKIQIDLKPSAKIGLVELMRKEVNLRRQIENIQQKLKNKSNTRKVSIQLQSRIIMLQNRLNEVLTDEKEYRCSSEYVEYSKVMKVNWNQPIDNLINSAKQESIEQSSLGYSTKLGDGDDDNYDNDDIKEYEINDNKNNVVIRGTDVIRRLLAEVRGNRRHNEETWERIILAERMRSSLSRYGTYHHMSTDSDDGKSSSSRGSGSSSRGSSSSSSSISSSYDNSKITSVDNRTDFISRYIHYINQECVKIK